MLVYQYAGMPQSKKEVLMKKKLIALILAAYNDNFIISFDIHLCHFRAPLLQNLGSERNDLHVVFISQLACHGPEYTGTFGLLVVVYDNCCILVETDVAAIVSSDAFNAAYYNSFYNILFLNNAAGCCCFYGCDDDVTYVGGLLHRTAQYFDALYHFSAGVIGYF